jgi:hypothetical protein
MNSAPFVREKPWNFVNAATVLDFSSKTVVVENSKNAATKLKTRVNAKQPAANASFRWALLEKNALCVELSEAVPVSGRVARPRLKNRNN